MLWFCSYLVCEINSQKNYHTQFEQTQSIFDNVQKFGPRSFGHCQICSEFAQIGCDIFFVSWFHTPNRSKIGAFLTTPKILDIWSKVLWCFSYLLCEINSQNEFITLNLSKFGAFLTIWSWIQIFEQCQKCSNCAHMLIFGVMNSLDELIL